MSPNVAIPLARLRAPLLMMLIALLVTDAWLQFVPGGWLAVWLVTMAFVAVLLRAGTLRRPAVPLQSPIVGRWKVYNSPATRVPSHGIQSYGQSYAVDLVADPPDGSRPRFGWWPPARRPEAFPGFGAAVSAPCAGTVVRVHDRERDHWSRTTLWGITYMFTVELLRELFGPNRILGNHVVIDRGDGTYVALAHLRRGSLRVRSGQSVRGGQSIAQCGNSGNSSEPHLHLQVMDHPHPVFAAGVPFRFQASSGAPLAVPGNGAHLVVPA